MSEFHVDISIGSQLHAVGNSVKEGLQTFLDSVKIMSSLNNSEIRDAIDSASITEPTTPAQIRELNDQADAFRRDAADGTIDGKEGTVTILSDTQMDENPYYELAGRPDAGTAASITVEGNEKAQNAKEASELAVMAFDLMGKAGVELTNENVGLYYGIMTGSMPQDQAIATIEWAVSRVEIGTAETAKLLKKCVELTKSISQKYCS